MSKYISKGQDIFLSEFKKISEFLLVCLIMAIFVFCFVDWNRDIEYDNKIQTSMLLELYQRVEKLEKYKKSCVKKTQDQHEINMKILEYIKPALPEKEFIELIKLVTGEYDES